MKLRTFIALAVLLSPQFVIAGILKGKVLDEKGLPLPYANVYVQGTTIGTSTNGDGVYELQLQPGLHQVLCQYMGYRQEKYNVTVSGEETVQHTFKLEAQGLEMKEVVIRANTEDPAYRIIREAIKRRSFHLDQASSSFQTSIYMKGVGRTRAIPKKILGQKVTASDLGVDTSGKGVLFLLEQTGDYYRQGSKERTVIHSVRQSGDKKGLGLSRFPTVMCFYDNTLRMSKGFVSPVADNALNYYKYKLIGEFTEQGRTIYKIQVLQKREFEPCFNGYVYIADSVWAIHSLDLVLTGKSNLDVFDTLRLTQQYIPAGADQWVIKNQVVNFSFKLFGLDIGAVLATVYNRQRINEQIPDTVFSSKITSIYDSSANKKDSVYWVANRPIPLEADEKKDYVVKDSIDAVESSPAYLDSVRRRGNKFKAFRFATFGYSYKGKHTTYTTNSLLLGLPVENMVNFNAIEGFNLAPKLSWTHSKDSVHFLNGAAIARYGFSNHHFNGIAKLYYQANDKTWKTKDWLAGIDIGQYVFQYNSSGPVLPWYNTYAALFARVNDLKIYERREVTGFAGRNYGNGFKWFVKASYQHRNPLTNSTDYSFFGSKNWKYTDNYPAPLKVIAEPWTEHNAFLADATVSFKPGITYTQYPDFKAPNGSSWPTFTANYQKGLAGIGDSKTNFDKWRFSITDNVSLRLLGSLSYNIAAGGFLSSKWVAAPDLMHLYGNRGIGYASPYLASFQFAQYYEFSNKTTLYGEAHVEYHLRGLLTNKIPLLKQYRAYLLLGGNLFRAQEGTYYYEAFAGLENLGWGVARILRIDFVQSWDSHMGRNSGIRFGFSSPNLSVSKNNPTNSEW